MFLVKVGEFEYVPHLIEGGQIRLQGMGTESIQLLDSWLLVKEVGRGGWCLSTLASLRNRLEAEVEELEKIQRRVLQGELIRDLNYLAETGVEITV